MNPPYRVKKNKSEIRNENLQLALKSVSAAIEWNNRGDQFKDSIEVQVDLAMRFLEEVKKKL